jgi:zinc/manganese transport system substrate-binding protein
MIFRILIVAAALLAATPALAMDKLKAVASFSILGDFVSRVGGDLVEVTTIVGPGGDAHVYEPRPDDAKAMAAAEIVFVNGLGFEGWMDRLVEASGYKGKIAVTTAGIAAAPMADDHDHEEHDHDARDPHAWQDARNAAGYVDNIAKALCAADAEDCAAYGANAAAYKKELAALDEEIRATIARVPSDRRTVITSHDAFGYFAKAYGVTFLAPEGVSTESEASAKDVAKLITQIKAGKASALFVETVSDPRLIEQIARETGLKIGAALYSDALSPPGGPAATYIDMMRHNAKALAGAMAGS